MAKTDVLVIGSGIAGLSVAIKVARQFPGRHCTVITKQESAESNTRYAQGGIAVVSDEVRDSFEDHIDDTLKAGDGLCDPAVVRHVVTQGPARLRELIELGTDFDRDASGHLVLGREGGHSANRIIHHRDTTGLNISTALLEKARSLPNITLLPHHIAIDLLTGEDGTTPCCCGALVFDLTRNQLESYHAAITVMATGGIGQLFKTTTNPLIATGDGIALAARAGANISNMEFIQFHPTAFYGENTNPAFLISEAVRGHGAYLRNAAGERFMFRYHPDGELACRDVVSRAIASEIQSGTHPHVFADCTHLSAGTLRAHFPHIYSTCLAKGIDISTDYIPVAPAAHYLCGGIDVDLRGRTSLKNLYACGECSNTGLHGANRLASNSLLEATVFAHNCFEDISCLFVQGLHFPVFAPTIVTPLNRGSGERSTVAEGKTRLQNVMSRYAGIVRSTSGLRSLLCEVEKMELMLAAFPDGVADPAWYELRNMVICARLIAEQSLARKENRGGFFNKDLQATHALA